jgi:hypothetical protein
MHMDGKPWIFTRNFAKKKGQSKFLARLDEARSYFPELNRQPIKLGITINADGKADLEGKGVFFRSRNVSFYVMGHELTHLLQEIQGLPKSERSCDIFTMARTTLFCDESPNYVNVPKEMIDENGYILEQYREFVHKTAKSASALRRAGKRFYITWFERTLETALEIEAKEQYETFETPEWMLLQEPIQTTLEEFLTDIQ